MCEILVVLVEPEHPGNVGATARLIKNFMGELVIVNPKFSSMDEAYALAKHGKDILEKARIVSSLEEALSDVDCIIATTAKLGDQYHVFRTAITPQVLAESMKSINGRVAILFGRESIGLTNEEIRLADIVVTIPTSNTYPTLNLSHAVAIILYELFKTLSTDNKRRIKARAAGRVEREQALKFFREIVQMLGYRQEKIPLVEKAFKNIISRAWISGREIYTLLGVLRKIKDSLYVQPQAEK